MPLIVTYVGDLVFSQNKKRRLSVVSFFIIILFRSSLIHPNFFQEQAYRFRGTYLLRAY